MCGGGVCGGVWGEGRDVRKCIRYVCGSLTEEIGKTHFGGFLKKRTQSQTVEEAKPKTRKQVMEEIVSKSKTMKVRTISHHSPLCYTPSPPPLPPHTHAHIHSHQYERQHEKLEAENLMEKLDSEWKEIQNSILSTVRH